MTLNDKKVTFQEKHERLVNLPVFPTTQKRNCVKVICNTIRFKLQKMTKALYKLSIWLVKPYYNNLVWGADRDYSRLELFTENTAEYKISVNSYL